MRNLQGDQGTAKACGWIDEVQVDLCTPHHHLRGSGTACVAVVGGCAARHHKAAGDLGEHGIKVGTGAGLVAGNSGQHHTVVLRGARGSGKTGVVHGDHRLAGRIQTRAQVKSTHGMVDTADQRCVGRDVAAADHLVGRQLG